ncbi:MmgE/PrpD family protein, partial [Streptosporangium amethystogenes]
MIARELAAWALGLTDVPASVRQAATRHLLDGIGTALGAYRTGAAAPALTVARDLGGPAEATVLGTGHRLSAPAAALANGTLVHAL